jgi:small subunit ribosomal protein S3
MGQKVNPIGLRLGINRTWDSRWFAGKNEYGKLLHEDVKIREILHKELKQAAVARIVIERPHKKCRVTIHSARPGVVIGKKGADIDKLRKRVAGVRDEDEAEKGREEQYGDAVEDPSGDVGEHQPVPV